MRTTEANTAVIYYTETDEAYSSGYSYYYYYNLSTSQLGRNIYNTFSNVGNVPRKFVMDPTGGYVYYVGGMYQQTLFKMLLSAPSAVHSDNEVFVGKREDPVGSQVVDGNFTAAKFYRLFDVGAPTAFSFFIVLDKAQYLIRKIDPLQSTVTTLVTRSSTINCMHVAPSGAFVVFANDYYLHVYFMQNASLVKITGGGQGYQDGVGINVKIGVVTNAVTTSDESFVYFAHDIAAGDGCVRRLHVYTRQSETLFRSSTHHSCRMLAFDRNSQYLFANFISTRSMLVYRNAAAGGLTKVHEFGNPEVYGSPLLALAMTVQGSYVPPATTTAPLITTTTTTAASTTTVRATTSTAQVVASTVSGSVQTTTSAPIVRVNVSVGESCLDYFEGFEDPFQWWDCCTRFDDTYGCNGKQVSVTTEYNVYTRPACPWRKGFGCNIVATSYRCFVGQDGGGCGRQCESGCKSKVACTNLPANAYYTGSGTTATNCPWLCFDNYESNGVACVLKANYTGAPAPNATTQLRCTSHAQCSHCPRLWFGGRSDLNVWGCSKYEIKRRDINLNTYSVEISSSYTQLFTGYCAYWTNYASPRYCVDPQYLPQLSYTRTCATVGDCEYCPKDKYYVAGSTDVVYGCYGSLPQFRWVDNVNGYVQALDYYPANNRQYLQREFQNNTCVYYENEVPYRCPDVATTTSTTALATTSVAVVPPENCAVYSDCGFCPATVTGGCNGVTIVAYVEGFDPFIIPNFNATTMAERRCIYLSAGAVFVYCEKPATTQAVAVATTAPAPVTNFCYVYSDCVHCPSDATKVCSGNACYYRGTSAWLPCVGGVAPTTAVQVLATSSVTSTTTSAQVTTSTTPAPTTAALHAARFELRSNKHLIEFLYERYKVALNETLGVRVDQIAFGTQVDKFVLPVLITHSSASALNETLLKLRDAAYPALLFQKFISMRLYDTLNLDPADTLYVDFTGYVEPPDLLGLPRVACTNWNPCNACPYGYSRGCSGRSLLVQSTANGIWLWMQNYVAPLTARDFCVFHNNAQWRYCPTDPLAAMRLTWQLILTILIRKAAVSPQEVDLYRLATAIVLGVNSSQITAGVYGSSPALGRRLLQSEETMLGMIVDLNSDQDLANMAAFVRTSVFQSGLDAALLQLTLEPAALDPASVGSYRPATAAAASQAVTVINVPAAKSRRAPAKQGMSETGALLVGVAAAGAGSMLLVVVCAVICSSMSAKNKVEDIPAWMLPRPHGRGRQRFRSFNGVQMSTKY